VRTARVGGREHDLWANRTARTAGSFAVWISKLWRSWDRSNKADWWWDPPNPATTPMTSRSVLSSTARGGFVFHATTSP